MSNGIIPANDRGNDRNDPRSPASPTRRSVQATSAETSGNPQGPFHAETAPGVAAQVVPDALKSLALIGGRQLLASAIFRITRDGDVTVQDARDEDLLETIQDAVISRRRRDVVRLEIIVRPDPHIMKWLSSSLALRPEQIYEIDGLLDAKSLMQILVIPPAQTLSVPNWPPQTPRDLVGAEDLWSAIQDRDVRLFHPYETLDPVVEMVSRAAQERFYEDTVAALRSAEQAGYRFRPLTLSKPNGHSTNG